MEIPIWSDAYTLGKKIGEALYDRPSSEDPTKSNGQVILEHVVQDVKNGRPLSKPYPLWKPLEEAARQGFIASAIDYMEEKIHVLDSDAPAE